MTRRPERILPPTYFLIAGAAMIVLHLFLPTATLLVWPWRAIGAPVVVAGIALAVIANEKFKEAGTTVKPFQISSALVTDGPFAYSRNPMYLGMLVVLLGLALLLGTVSPLVVMPPFFWLLQERFVLPEEGMLEIQFGEEWLDYKRRVRRWL